MIECNPPEKVVIDEKEPDGVDTDDIGDLEDLPRLLLIDEGCENLRVVVDGEKLARDIKQKNKPDIL